jgi:hypothetical protein
MSRQSSLDFWARLRGNRAGCPFSQAYELEELVADEYDGEWNDDEDGPRDDEWINAAYMRQAESNEDRA